MIFPEFCICSNKLINKSLHISSHKMCYFIQGLGNRDRFYVFCTEMSLKYEILLIDSK